VGRAHRINVVEHNHLAEHQSMVFETPSKLNNMDVTIRMDLGATEIFISPSYLLKCKLAVVEKIIFD
jgi:hypothetical protein